MQLATHSHPNAFPVLVVESDVPADMTLVEWRRERVRAERDRAARERAARPRRGAALATAFVTALRLS